MEALILPQEIDLSSDYLESLESLIHPRSLLTKRGYVLDPLSKKEIEKKKRCQRCSKAITHKDGRNMPADQPNPIVAVKPTDHFVERDLNGAPLQPQDDYKYLTLASRAGASANFDDLFNELSGKSSQKENKPPVMRCNYHTGSVQYKKWTCCNEHVMAKPCAKDQHHLPKTYKTNELEDFWRFHTTPASSPGNMSRHKTFLAAVAIDCEMGVNDYGESELIRVSLIDYFSGQVLIDRLVFPDVKMKHFNTKYSGVSFKDMSDARKKRTCYFGAAQAREAIWRYVGPDTIVVGHSPNGDLISLRWIHHRVVDTLLIEEAVIERENARIEWEKSLLNTADGDQLDQVGLGGEGENQGGHDEQDEKNEDSEKKKGENKEKGPPKSLKSLSKLRLGREIQIKGQGHDSVEDAVASRDLLHWHITNRMEWVEVSA